MIGRILCALGLHKWRRLQSALSSRWYYCVRPGCNTKKVR